MSYLPIQGLNLKKAQVDIDYVAVVKTSVIDINLGTLVADDDSVTKTNGTSVTLKSGTKSYFIFVNLVHRHTYMFDYDIYLDGVRANQCSILSEANTAGKHFAPQNGMALVINPIADVVLTIRNLTTSNSTPNDTIYYNNADASIPNGAITILYY